MTQKKGTKKIKMRITVKVFVVLLAFAGVLLSGYGAAGPGGKTTGTRRNCPLSFTKTTMPPSMANYFTSGTCNTCGSSAPDLKTFWTYDSCCTQYCTYKRSKTKLLPGGFQQCTYVAATKTCSSSCVGPTSTACPGIVAGENPTLVFTCPSTGCF